MLGLALFPLDWIGLDVRYRSGSPHWIASSGSMGWSKMFLLGGILGHAFRFDKGSGIDRRCHVEPVSAARMHVALRPDPTSVHSIEEVRDAEDHDPAQSHRTNTGSN